MTILVKQIPAIPASRPQGDDHRQTVVDQNFVESRFDFPRLHSSRKAWRLLMWLEPPSDLDTTWSTSVRRSLLVAPQSAHRPLAAASTR